MFYIENSMEFHYPLSQYFLLLVMWKFPKSCWRYEYQEDVLSTIEELSSKNSTAAVGGNKTLGLLPTFSKCIFFLLLITSDSKVILASTDSSVNLDLYTMPSKSLCKLLLLFHNYPQLISKHIIQFMDLGALARQHPSQGMGFKSRLFDSYLDSCTKCVTLDKLFSFSKSQFLYL